MYFKNFIFYRGPPELNAPLLTSLLIVRFLIAVLEVKVEQFEYICLFVALLRHLNLSNYFL